MQAEASSVADDAATTPPHADGGLREAPGGALPPPAAGNAQEADSYKPMLEATQSAAEEVPSLPDLELPDLDTAAPAVLAQCEPAVEWLEGLCHLVSESNEVVSQVAGKEVVLVVGFTGVGKTSLIHFLAGSTLAEAPHHIEEGLHKSVFVTDEIVDGLGSFLIGHKSESQTKVMMSFQAPGSCHVYVDSPGQFDTRGDAVDIATAIAYQEVAKACSRLRFVVVISCACFFDARAGLLRDVASHVSKAVKDFKKDQGAFSFVFTHVNRLDAFHMSMCDDAARQAAVRKEVLSRIMETALTTTDAETNFVLRRMQQCLEKQAFAQIFHPGWSTREDLLRHVQSKGKDIPGPTNRRPVDVVRCQISPKNHSKITVQLDRLIRDMEDALGEESFAKVREHKRMLECLARHMQPDVACVNSCMKKLGIMTLQMQRQLSAEAMSLLEAGTSDDRSFGTVEAARVLRITHMLSELDAEDTAKQVLQDISVKLRRFQGLLLDACENALNAGLDLSVVITRLSKLKAWKEAGAEDFAWVYEGAISALQELERRACHAGEVAEESCPARVTRAAVRLQHIMDNSALLHDHFSPVAADAQLPALLAKAENGIRAVAKKGIDSINAACDMQGSSTEADKRQHIQACRAEAATLHSVSDVFQELRWQVPQLQRCLSEAQQQLRQGICGCMASLGNQADELLQKGSLAPLEDIMRTMHSIEHDVGMEVRTIDHRTHTSYMEELVNFARDQCIRLEEQISLGQQADTQKQVQLVETLRDAEWLDSLLPPEKQLVGGTLERTRSHFQAHGRSCREDFASLLESYLKAEAHTKQDVLPGMHASWSRLKGLAALHALYPQLAEEGEKAETFVKEQLCKRHLDSLPSLPSKNGSLMIEDLQTSQAHHINELLQVARDLSFLEPAQAVLKPSAEEVDVLLQGSETTLLERSFDDLSKVLDIVKCWDGASLRQLQMRMPTLAAIRDQLLCLFTQRMNGIEELLKESPDAAGPQLTALREACRPSEDDEVCKKIWWELTRVRQLLEMKQQNVIQEIQEAVEFFNFEKVARYVKPANPDDGQEQEKCRVRLTTIHDCIAGRIGQVHANVKAGTVAKDIADLERAAVQIGDILKEEVGMDILQEVQSVKEALQQQVTKLLDALAEDVQGPDYSRMLQAKDACESYFELVAPILTTSNKVQWEKLKTKVEQQLTRIDDETKSFIKKLTALAEKREAIDLSKLIIELDRLSVGIAEARLKGPYDSHVEILKHAIQDFHNTQCNRIRATSSFTEGVEIYGLLSKAFNAGLAKHMAGLDFNPGEVLSMMEGWQREQHEHFKASLYDEDVIVNEFLPRFKKLYNTGSYSWLGSWEPCFEYHAQCEILRAELLQSRQSTSADLNRGDHEAAGCHLLLLLRLWRHLRDFVPKGPTAYMQELGELGRHVLESLKTCTNGMAETLSISQVPDLEMHFCRVRSFVLHVCHVLVSHHGHMQKFPESFQDFHKKYKPQLALAHSGLAKFLEQALTAFQQQCHSLDFEKLATSVQQMRALGQLLATHIAAYRQDLHEQHYAPDDGLKALVKLQEHFGGKSLGDFGKHYAVLQLQADASTEDVRKRFKELSLRHHPDKVRQRRICVDPNAAQQRITEAHAALTGTYKGRSLEADIAQLFSGDINRAVANLPKRIKELLKDEGYEQVRRLADTLPHLVELSKRCGLTRTPEQVKGEVHEVIRSEVMGLEGRVQELWHEQKLLDLQRVMDTLAAMSKSFSGLGHTYSHEWRDNIVGIVKAKIDHIADEALQSLHGAEDKINDFAAHLVQLGRIYDELKDFQGFVAQKVNNLLELCQAQSWGFGYMFKLGMLLESGKVGRCAEDEHAGKVIVSEFKQFKDVMTLLFNKQTSFTQKDIEETLKHLDRFVVGTNGLPVKVERDEHPALASGTQMLKTGYEQYLEEYERVFNCWHATELTEKQIPELAWAEVKAMGWSTVDSSDWPKHVKERVPKLLAMIFAYFTISKSGDSYRRLTTEVLEDEGRGADTESMGSSLSGDLVLVKPHSIQILTLLHLLGFDCEDEALKSRLMQVRTGEGKSIILGGLAALCGLVGFRVRCICYSAFLSERDYGFFEELFDAFGVKDRIRYSKITDFSEERASAQGDIRALTRDLLNGSLRAPSGSQAAPAKATVKAGEALASSPTACAAMPKASGRSEVAMPCTSSGPRSVACDSEEVLLVDEVDVFFGQDFYPQTYNQVVMLEVPEVFEILKFLWQRRDSRDKPRALLQMVKNECSAYRQLVSKFKDWDFLIESEVTAMCADLKDYDAVPVNYDRILNKIGYKVMDGYDYNVVYGYRTAFSYLEVGSGLRNEEDTLREALRLRVSCGQFSYANIGKPTILGVSGTVRSLGKHEWSIMRTYGIQRFTLMPSVYGASNWTYAVPAITVSRSADHFRDIVHQAKGVVERGRAVIIFLRDLQHLQDFESTGYAKEFHAKNILKESLSDKDKYYAIKRAATCRQVTIATAIFGRGTDFFCSDNTLEDAGGVHVIQAFFSSDKSEEVQIQGRTARQGKKGTFAWVLNEEEVKDMGLDPFDLRSVNFKGQLAMLEEARSHGRALAIKDMQENFDRASEKDALTRDLFNTLLNGDSAGAASKFRNFYEKVVGKRAAGGGACRLMCLSDATGSMGGIWGATRQQIQDMLGRVGEIGGEGSLELMWVAYRDYSDAQLLEKSGWCKADQVHALQHFVQSIRCGGGGDGEEAVERALMEVRQEHAVHPVDRAILIGDAPPHFERSGQKLQHHNHTYEMDYRDEAKALAELGIPVFSFVVGGHQKTMETFGEISKPPGYETEGQVANLTSPDQLIDVVCITALDAIGGSELVAEYTRKYQ